MIIKLIYYSFWLKDFVSQAKLENILIEDVLILGQEKELNNYKQKFAKFIKASQDKTVILPILFKQDEFQNGKELYHAASVIIKKGKIYYLDIDNKDGFCQINKLTDNEFILVETEKQEIAIKY